MDWTPLVELVGAVLGLDADEQEASAPAATATRASRATGDERRIGR